MAQHGKLASSATDTAAITWGELLADAQSGSAQPSDARPLPLLVDARALADIGLSARTPVRLPSPDDANGGPLAQADLVLLVDRQAIVLTSVPRQPSGQDRGRAAILRAMPQGPFDAQLRQSLAGNSERFVPVEPWNFSDGKSPWATATPASDAPVIDHAGWTVYDLDLAKDSRRIGIVDRDLMVLVGCGLFLLATMLVFAKGDISWKRQGIVLTVATAIALLLPESCAPLGAGLWLGLAAGWSLRWLARWDRPLGAYSLRLLEAATIGAPPKNGPIGDSGEATLPSIPVQLPNPQARSDSKSQRGKTLPPKSIGSSIRKRGGPAGPTLGLLLMLGCLAWHDAGAAEPAGDAAAGAVAAGRAKAQANSNAGGDSEAIPQVLIPIDDQQHLKGKIYLVPEGLYAELIRRGDRTTEPTTLNWLIPGATYRWRPDACKKNRVFGYHRLVGLLRS